PNRRPLMHEEDSKQSSPPPASLEALALRVAELERELTASRRGIRARFGRGGKFWLIAGAMGALLGIGSVARYALSQSTCAQVLPAPMTTFCSGTPAIASQVNGNFKQLADWTAAKVGTLSDPNVTVAGTLTEQKDVKVAGALDFGANVRQMITLWNPG